MNRRKFKYIIFIGLILLLVSSSFAVKKYDMVSQRDLYPFTSITTAKSPSCMMLIEVKDSRPDTEKNGGILENQTVDADWARPVEGMIRELMNLEMQRAGLIKLVKATPENSEYRLTLEILSFYAGAEKNESKSKMKNIFVPKMAKGYASIRAILQDKTNKEIMNIDFSSTAEQELPRLTNAHGYAIRNSAAALKETLMQIIMDVDAHLSAKK